MGDGKAAGFAWAGRRPGPFPKETEAPSRAWGPSPLSQNPVSREPTVHMPPNPGTPAPSLAWDTGSSPGPSKSERQKCGAGHTCAVSRLSVHAARVLSRHAGHAHPHQQGLKCPSLNISDTGPTVLRAADILGQCRGEAGHEGRRQIKVQDPCKKPQSS